MPPTPPQKKTKFPYIWDGELKCELFTDIGCFSWFCPGHGTKSPEVEGDFHPSTENYQYRSYVAIHYESWNSLGEYGLQNCYSDEFCTSRATTLNLVVVPDERFTKLMREEHFERFNKIKNYKRIIKPDYR